MLRAVANQGGGGGGSGTVNSGLINQLAYYAAAGTTVSGSANIGTSSTGQLIIIPATPHLGSNGAAILINGNAAAEVIFPHPVSVLVQGADGENDGFHVGAFGVNTVGGFIGRHSLGTAASPLGDTAGTQLVRLAGRGYKATGYSNNIGGVGLFAADTFTDASTPTYLSLFTNATATTDTQVEVLRGQPGGGVSVGNATYNATDRATGILAVQTGLTIASTAQTFPASGLIVGTTDAQTLTNKTIVFSSNTLTGVAPLASPTFTGLVTINDNTVASPGTIANTALLIQGADATRSALELQTYGTGAQTFARIAQRRFGGTAAAPTATPAAAVLGNNIFGGWDGSAIQSGAVIQATAINLWSGSDRSTSFDIQTTASSSTSLLSQLRVQGSGGLSVGNANIATDGGAGVVVATSFTGAGTGLTGTAASLTAGTVTTNANLTGPITSSGNATSVAAQTGTGTTFVMNTSPTLVTPALGVATATSINGNTFTTGTYTLTGTAAKTLTFSNSLTLAGTDATTMTFPTTSATIARTDSAQTFTGAQTFSSSPVINASISLAGASAINWSGRGSFTSSATGTIQHGAADAASPVAQTVSFQSVVAGNANTAGANATIQGSLSNGSGGGDILVKTTLSNAASGTQNTAATAVTFKGGDQSIIMASTTDATSTSTGAVQIAGGMSITKRVFAAGLTASAGLQTAVICLSSANELIADSVACLASSERFKQDIAPSDLGLAAVMAMKPIVYRYAPTGNARFDEAPNQRDIHAGFLAEDLAKIDRRFVAFDANGMVRTSRQETIEASFALAIQQQQARIDALERGMSRH